MKAFVRLKGFVGELIDCTVTNLYPNAFAATLKIRKANISGSMDADLRLKQDMGFLQVIKDGDVSVDEDAYARLLQLCADGKLLRSALWMHINCLKKCQHQVFLLGMGSSGVM
jgi:hypothetical protein